MAHLRILDGYAPVVRDALPDTRSLRSLLEVLGANLAKRREVRRDVRVCMLGYMALDPLLEVVELLDEHADRARLLLGIEPVDVERRLDAGHQQHFGAGTLGDGRRPPS